jgi:hypothetical protein
MESVLSLSLDPNQEIVVCSSVDVGISLIRTQGEISELIGIFHVEKRNERFFITLDRENIEEIHKLDFRTRDPFWLEKIYTTLRSICRLFQGRKRRQKNSQECHLERIIVE